jgi:hypothetical protein
MVPWQLVAAQAQADQPQGNGGDEQERSQHVDLSLDDAEARADIEPTSLVAEDQGPQYKRERRDGDLEEEAPAPADAVGDGAAEARPADGAEAEHAILHGLVHAPLAEGDHV